MLQHIPILLSLLRLPKSHKGQAEASGDGKRPRDMSFEMCQLQACHHKSHDVHDPHMI